MENKTKVQETLKQFWNEALTLSEEQKEEIRKFSEMDYRELAPAPKLADAVSALGRCKKVLDYGCGDGWAGIIASLSGCPDVVCADLGKDIIETVKVYAEAFHAKVDAKVVSSDWLTSLPGEFFDGAVCSNVLDVVPWEIGQEIIAQLARVVASGSPVIIGLNFYMSPELAKQRGMELVEGRYLFVNDVLRLHSQSDEEWKKAFEPYFEVERLDYFAWAGEAKESRRLFYLRKK